MGPFFLLFFEFFNGLYVKSLLKKEESKGLIFLLSILKKLPSYFTGALELKKAYDFRQMLFSLNIMTSYDYILPYGFLMSIVLLHIFLFFMLFLFQYTTAHLPEPFDMNIG